jgi:hypothetical protein
MSKQLFESPVDNNNHNNNHSNSNHNNNSPSYGTTLTSKQPQQQQQQTSRRLAANYEERSQKIDDFNSKLHSTLHGIHDILATLPYNNNTTNNNNTSKRSSPLQTKQSKTNNNSSNISNDTSIPLSVRDPSPPPATSSTTAPIKCTASIGVCGKLLRMYILSTHGDNNYVGLNGLLCYTATTTSTSTSSPELGIQPLTSQVHSISTIPRDLGLLPGYEDDPRIANHLIQPPFDTRDDMHQWLAPQREVAKEYLSATELLALQFSIPSNNNHNNHNYEAIAMISIEFITEIQLVFIQILNFNKSRTQNQRGIKDYVLFLDDQLIHAG